MAEKHEILVINNFNEPEYLDPTLLNGTYESAIVMNLFEGLVMSDPKDGHPVAAGAETWTISSDQKIYTFHLRKNATWSDGHPVTASDYAYTWERALNPKTGAAYAFALYYIKNAQEYNAGKISDPKQLGIRVVDPYTLEMTLNHPTPFFLAFMCYPTFYPVPSWAIEKHGPQWTRPENIVTNGPFKLSTWIPNKEILIEKSPSYWDRDKVRLAGARFLPIEDKETGLRMYDNNQIDLNLWLPEKKIPVLQGRSDIVNYPQFSSYMYLFNVKKAPLDNPKVRQALMMAIDRKTLVEKYLQGAKTPTSAIVPPGVPGYKAPNGFGFDPKRARELLAEAGYGNPSLFPTFSLKYNTDAQHQLVAQVLQQMWKENLGIKVALINEEWKTYSKSRDSSDYELCRFKWVGDYLDPNTFLEIFLGDSVYNSTGWANASYDRLMKQSLSEPDKTKRFSLLNQAEAILLQEAPVLPLFIESKFYLIRPYVKGVYPNLQDHHPLKEVFLDFTH